MAVAMEAVDFTAAAVDFMVAAVDFMGAVAAFTAAAFTAVAGFMVVDFMPPVDFAAAAECARVAVNSAPDRAEFVRLRGHLGAIDLSPSTTLRTARSDATRA